ncbi:MAG: DNA repair protein RecN (Recombination protein N) [bacterium F082]|nr:MAG: DNA repair protein RecN (Recombination protein N) [bacterium F082]KWW31092.1 MAG: DNA repair protein RecN (Recombination protein N) [bacterium P201]
MLQQLHISNYALIDELSVSFEPGFNVITGETGAGKSILLGALGFALGDRADTNVLYDKDKKCVVEAHFALDDDMLRPLFEENDLDFEAECIFRRELNPQKKSRAFINDTPVALQTMKEIGCQLADIHSQHDSLLLTDADFQLRLLDDIAQNGAILADYQTEYHNYNGLKRRLNELKEMADKNTAENDYLKFQLEELDKAGLKEGEYADIEQTLSVMENAEEIKTLLVTANGLLDNSENAILGQVNELTSTLSRLRHLLPDTDSLGARVENLKVELKDIAYDLRRKEDDTQFDEGQLQSLQERYDLLSRLMMKHHVNDFEALITLRDSLKERVNAFENIDEAIAKAEKELKESEKRLSQQAKVLHDKRVEAATAFSEKVATLVRQLAMPFAQFQVSVEKQENFGNKGTDAICFLFSANKGVAPDDLRRVASGGELSRLMLSIKSAVSEYNYIPTLIFDEIDTGVSGEVAAKIGGIMRQMGNALQLISITHLPQVASKARHHYFIYKDNDGLRTQSHIRMLNAEERVTEIAKMLSNDQVTPEALRAAEVLLK